MSSELESIRFEISVQRKIIKRTKDKYYDYSSQEKAEIERLGKEAFRKREEELQLEIFEEERRLRELQQKENEILYGW